MLVAAESRMMVLAHFTCILFVPASVPSNRINWPALVLFASTVPGRPVAVVCVIVKPSVIPFEEPFICRRHDDVAFMTIAVVEAATPGTLETPIVIEPIPLPAGTAGGP
jgi:hypothetical protein